MLPLFWLNLFRALQSVPAPSGCSRNALRDTPTAGFSGLLADEFTARRSQFVET
jgi:hypothetical protein